MQLRLVTVSMLLLFVACQKENAGFVTVPIVLDHNRMLVDGEIQRKDGTWLKVRFWVDTGNPDFFMNESLARDAGISDSGAASSLGVHLGGMNLDFAGVKPHVMSQPFWLFSATHASANLPSSVLKKYHVVFDYPGLQLTIAEPGRLKVRGVPFPAGINPANGIVQLDAVVDGDSLSLALDNGASYSFISAERLSVLMDAHPQWPRMTGTAGCANMWGWWPPNEQTFPVARVAEMLWGPLHLQGVGIVGVPKFSPDGPTLGAWYSRKTVRPVDGFLGPNAFKAFRVEIDYGNGLVCFEKGAEPDTSEMDVVGISLRQLPDSSYQVVGIAGKDGMSGVAGVQSGDMLLGINDLQTRGETMGRVVDALRGKPGEVRILWIERNGKRIKAEARVKHLL